MGYIIERWIVREISFYTRQKLYTVGADYVRNILYQEMTPVSNHLPVRLKKEELNEIRLTTPALAEYDAIALKRRNSND